MRLAGLMIADVRNMTAKETSELAWTRGGVVIELINGARLFAARDEEQNGPGALFVVSQRGVEELVRP